MSKWVVRDGDKYLVMTFSQEKVTRDPVHGTITSRAPQQKWSWGPKSKAYQWDTFDAADYDYGRILEAQRDLKGSGHAEEFTDGTLAGYDPRAAHYDQGLHPSKVNRPWRTSAQRKASAPTMKRVMDQETAEHFYKWMENNVHESKQDEVEEKIHAILKDEPGLLQTHGWTEILNMAEAGGYGGTMAGKRGMGGKVAAGWTLVRKYLGNDAQVRYWRDAAVLANAGIPASFQNNSLYVPDSFGADAARLTGPGTRGGGMRGSGDAADEDAARELEIFIHNDADLYRQQFQPIQKNLITKKARGVYDREKAVKLFMYLMESGAKKYSIEFGNGRTDPGEWHRTFSKPTREAAARIFVDEFETEAGYGNYDNYLPKKYQKKAGMGAGGRKSKMRWAAAEGTGHPSYATHAKGKHKGAQDERCPYCALQRLQRRGMGSVGDGYAPLASLPADLRAAVSQTMASEGKDASRYVWKHDGNGNVECKER